MLSNTTTQKQPACRLPIKQEIILSLQYGNECEMLKAACERNMAISFLHHGPCAGTMDRRNFHGKSMDNSRMR